MSEFIASPILKKIDAGYNAGKYKYIINQGGTSSGKTYSLLQWLVLYSLKHKVKIDIVSESVPHLRAGVINDMYGVCNGFGIEFDKFYNKSDKVFKYGEGVINFIAFDKIGKAHGGRREILFLNEANNLAWEIVEQLMIRTSGMIFIDYNPTSEFWCQDEIMRKEPKRCLLIKSTYKDNPFLSKSIIESIESKKGDNNFWRVYGLGEFGISEGLVFNNFGVLDFDKNKFDKYFWGLDWGFSCLKGDTLILTDKGNKKIKDIEVGDKVLTRDGFKYVLKKMNNGIKKVYSLDFGYGKNIIATGDHRIFTYDGWKRVDELKGVEALCVKKLSLMGEFIKGIQKVSILITSFATKGIEKEDYIGIYGNFIMGKCRKGMLYIIKTITHLITILLILPVLLLTNIQKYIIKIISVLFHEKLSQNTDTQKKTGKKEEKKHLKQHNQEGEDVENVEKKSLFQTFIKNIALQDVEKKQTQEKVKQSILAKFVEKLFSLALTMTEKPARRNVRINLTLLKDKEEVFDITTENGEFFANGLLVHNCDPFAFVECAIDGRELYICKEIYQKGLLNREAIPLVRSIAGGNLIIADSAEPKSIAEFSSAGLNIIGARKGKGSIESGIKFLQDFKKIWIHKDCIHTLNEFKNYQWEKDKMTGKSLPKPVDAFNHILDSLRYALSYEIGRFKEHTQERLTFQKELEQQKMKDEWVKLFNDFNEKQSVYVFGGDLENEN